MSIFIRLKVWPDLFQYSVVKEIPMQKQEIYQQISTLLIKLFEIDEDDISPDAELYEDLDLDSIDAVDLVVHLQKITGRKIRPDMFKSVRTVQDVVDAIDELLNTPAA
ncbi:diguanylate cyclase [Campylobacter jejuni]|nr:diguanylate cyclase [Campylobacter jejuni]